MRPGWAALPVLAVLASGLACSPVGNLQTAARSLRFTVDRVEPSLELAFPLDRSRLAVRISCTVENPSSTAFHLKGFDGVLRLEAPDGTFSLGQVGLVQPMDLLPQGRASLAVAVAFAYQDLQAHWPALQAALAGGAQSAWSLEGPLRLEAYGVTWSVPVKTRQVLQP